jgi:nitrate/nitrite transporter NarK
MTPGARTVSRVPSDCHITTAFGGGLGSVVFTQIIREIVDLQGSFKTIFLIVGILPLIAAAIVPTVTGRLEQLDCQKLAAT